MKKKERAVVFIVNSQYLFALSAIMINLQSLKTRCYDNIIVYSSDLSRVDKDKILQIESDVQFIDYSYDDWLSDHKAPESALAKNFMEKYSHLAWSKYKVFEQLEYYKKILFLDLDILIKRDLMPIFQIQTGIAWRSGQNFHGKFGDKKSLLDKISHIPKDYPSPNGGLIYATDSFDYKKFIRDARLFTTECLDYFASALDELAIAWATYNNHVQLTQLNEMEFNTIPSSYALTTRLIHFMGEEKIWNHRLLQLVFPEWMEYYKKSININGLQSDKVKFHENLGDTMRKQLNATRWHNMLKYGNINIPEDLKLNFDFDHEWLILKYKNGIYYEFKFSQFHSGYSVGLWIRDRFYLSDKVILRKIDELVNESAVFKKTQDKRGVYIYTNKVGIEDISSLFDYFTVRTKYLFD